MNCCRVPFVGVIVIVAALAWGAPSALACSICRCGDPTFNALGKEGFNAKGLRLALDWERFDKDEGDPALGSESQVENRFTALASYGFSDRLSLTARVPLSGRHLVTTAPGTEPETTRPQSVRIASWRQGGRPTTGRRSASTR
jgi:hypothetical protein